MKEGRKSEGGSKGGREEGKKGGHTYLVRKKVDFGLILLTAA